MSDAMGPGAGPAERGGLLSERVAIQTNRADLIVRGPDLDVIIGRSLPVSPPSGGGVTRRSTGTITRTALNLLSTITFGDGEIMTFNYDTNDRLAGVATNRSETDVAGFTYNDAGLLTGVTF